jgi:hypothetical protein
MFKLYGFLIPVRYVQTFLIIIKNKNVHTYLDCTLSKLSTIVTQNITARLHLSMTSYFAHKMSTIEMFIVPVSVYYVLSFWTGSLDRKSPFDFSTKYIAFYTEYVDYDPIILIGA